jgi:formylglycine-generating enzyme required for sulfatase activity
MNHATRSRLAVLLIVTVIELASSVVLADAASDYEAIFGTEARNVAASRTKTDDATFAAKLIKTAKKRPDSPAFQILLYEKAYQFGSAGIAGCETALEALKLLEKVVPEKRAQWRQKKLAVVKLRFDKSYGAARKVAAQPYMEMLEAVADAHIVEGNGSKARLLYRLAAKIAVYVKSPRLAEILAKSRHSGVVVAQEAKLKSLQAKFKKNAQDTTARKELTLFYLVELDKPAEAARLLTDDLDEATRTYVPLAAGKLDGLDEMVCLELGDWYYEKLSKNASVTGKSVVLRRARGYYRRFLERHAKKDVELFRVKTALENIDKELKKLNPPATHVSRPESKTLILSLGKGVTMKLVRISAGKFMMGSPEMDKRAGWNEHPQRQVTISKAFYMGVTEATQAQWKAVMNTEPWKDMRYTKLDGGNAVGWINWNDANKFCEILSKKIRKKVMLPTEAQWEYACRAGSKTAYCFGDDSSKLGTYAWYRDNAYGKYNRQGYAHAVGQKKPNRWGLYDMHGNVLEWCRDFYRKDFYAKAKSVDPENTQKTARTHILRGGSWQSFPKFCRAAARDATNTDLRSGYNGFRVVVVSDSGVSTRKAEPPPPSTKAIIYAKLIKATYGRGKRVRDVTNVLVKQKDEAGTICIYGSYNDHFGDPAADVVKELIITFELKGKKETVTFPENTPVMLKPSSR